MTPVTSRRAVVMQLQELATKRLLCWHKDTINVTQEAVIIYRVVLWQGPWYQSSRRVLTLHTDVEPMSHLPALQVKLLGISQQLNQCPRALLGDNLLLGRVFRGAVPPQHWEDQSDPSWNSHLGRSGSYNLAL